MSKNFKQKFVAPCDLEILNIEDRDNKLVITFKPLSESLIVPCDGVIDSVKPFNFDYTIKLNDKESTLQLILGEDSAKAFGFGFEMKVAIGQPVSLGDKLVNMNFDDLKTSIKSFVSKMSLQINHKINLKCTIGQKLKQNTEIFEV